MERSNGLADLLKRAIVPAICVMLMLYFVVSAVTGPTGVLAWRGFAQDKARADAEAKRLAQEKAALAKQVQLLDPRGADPDLADELVRRNLNVVKPDEVIITLPDKAPETVAE